MSSYPVPRLDGSVRSAEFEDAGPFTSTRPAVGEYFMFVGVLRLRINDKLARTNVMSYGSDNQWYATAYYPDPSQSYRVLTKL